MKSKIQLLSIIFFIIFSTSCGIVNREMWFNKDGSTSLKVEILAGDFQGIYPKCHHNSIKSIFIEFQNKAKVEKVNTLIPVVNDMSNTLITIEDVVVETAVSEDVQTDEITIEAVSPEYDDSPILKEQIIMKGLYENVDTIFNLGNRLSFANILPIEKSAPLNKIDVHYINQVAPTPNTPNANIIQATFDCKTQKDLQMYYDEVANISKQLKSFYISPFENIFFAHDSKAKTITGSEMIFERDQNLIQKIAKMNDEKLSEFLSSTNKATSNLIFHLPGKLNNVVGANFQAFDESTVLINIDLISLYRDGVLPKFIISYN